jgi:hypothetical protein
MVKPIEKVFICLSLEEVAVHAGHEVLMKVDLYFTDCGDLQEILDQQLRDYF